MCTIATFDTEYGALLPTGTIDLPGSRELGSMHPPLSSR